MTHAAWLPLGCVALALGCGPAVAVDMETGAGESSTGAGSTTGLGSGSSTPPNTTASPTTTPTTTPNPTTDPTVPTATDPTFGSDSSSGFMESSSGSSSGGGWLPDGADCSENGECNSGHCYVNGIGGICGECSGDADCEFGCTVPNPLTRPPEGSACNAGNLAENCETEAACVDDLECVTIVDVPGIVSVSSCSECDLDNDCLPGDVCNIEVEIAELSGVWTCTPIGTRPLGSTCAPEGSGDLACGSGVCAEAWIKGLLMLGVCSECDDDNPCDAGQSCVAAEVSLDGMLVPGTCQ